MQIVNFLAQLIGFSAVTVALALLINKKNVDTIFQLMENSATLFFIGVINIVVGIALLLSYHTWNLSWAVIITMLGWLIVIRGALILFFPNVAQKIIAAFKNNNDWTMVVLTAAVLFGCLLIYIGFTF